MILLILSIWAFCTGHWVWGIILLLLEDEYENMQAMKVGE